MQEHQVGRQIRKWVIVGVIAIAIAYMRDNFVNPSPIEQALGDKYGLTFHVIESYRKDVLSPDSYIHFVAYAEEYPEFKFEGDYFNEERIQDEFEGRYIAFRTAKVFEELLSPDKRHIRIVPRYYYVLGVQATELFPGAENLELDRLFTSVPHVAPRVYFFVTDDAYVSKSIEQIKRSIHDFHKQYVGLPSAEYIIAVGTEEQIKQVANKDPKKMVIEDYYYEKVFHDRMVTIVYENNLFQPSLEEGFQHILEVSDAAR